MISPGGRGRLGANTNKQSPASCSITAKPSSSTEEQEMICFFLRADAISSFSPPLPSPLF